MRVCGLDEHALASTDREDRVPDFMDRGRGSHGFHHVRVGELRRSLRREAIGDGEHDVTTTVTFLEPAGTIPEFAFRLPKGMDREVGTIEAGDGKKGARDLLAVGPDILDGS